MDLFSYYKVHFTILMTFIAFIIYMINRKNINGIKKAKEYKWMLLFFICILISFILSDYKEIALHGFVFRYEGIVLLISYLFILYFTINIFDYEIDQKRVLIALMIPYVIISIVGILQYLNSDIITTEFVQKLIIPREHEYLVGTLKGSTKANQKVAGLIGNSNYFGQYYAIILPIFIVMSIYSEEKKYKVIYGIMSFIGVLMTIISLSETGMISVFITGIILLLLNIKSIFKKSNKKILIIGSSLILIVAFVEIAFKGPIYNKVDDIIQEIKYEITAAEEKILIQKISLNDNRVNIKYKNREINIVYYNDDNSAIVKNSDGMILHKEFDVGKRDIVTNLDEREIKVGFKEHKYSQGKMIYIGIGNSIQFKLVIDDGKFKFMNSAGNIIEQDGNIDIAFGEGNEEVLTSRVYIWSRAIPKIMEKPFFGYGADTFEVVFPNHDYAGLYKAYNRSKIIVDKPHNMYIGIASNLGIIALIAFLAINFIYIKNSLLAIKMQGIKNSEDIYRMGILLCIITYLISGIMYDSNIVSTSIYYILLGIGINMNYKYEKNKI